MLQTVRAVRNEPDLSTVYPLQQGGSLMSSQIEKHMKRPGLIQ